MPDFSNLQSEYARLWRAMQISAADHAIIAPRARIALKHKPRYVAIEQQIGVPWFLVTILHNREAAFDFRCHLHNGDPLTSRTVQVPAGRPREGRPPYTWEESALDALTMPPHELHRVNEWTIERICYEAEKYNGWGYRHRATPSAYLWSHSNNYTRVKYVADGVWSAVAVDKQIGCMPLLRVMMELDPAIGEALDLPPPVPRPAPANGAPAPLPPAPPPTPPPPDIEPPAPEPKSPAESKSVWAALATLLTSILGAATDWRVLAVFIVGALAGFIIYERLKKSDIAKGPLLSKLLRSW
jgi:lysozyme family protein